MITTLSLSHHGIAIASPAARRTPPMLSNISTYLTIVKIVIKSPPSCPTDAPVPAASVIVSRYTVHCRLVPAGKVPPLSHAAPLLRAAPAGKIALRSRCIAPQSPAWASGGPSPLTGRLGKGQSRSCRHSGQWRSRLCDTTHGGA